MIPIRDTVPSRIRPLTTWTIILANVGVFIYELTLGPEQLLQLFQNFGVVPAFLEEVLRKPFDPLGYLPVFSSMFLHSGWLHLGFNLWTFWIFADNVEDRMGHGRFLVFYLLCGIVSGIVHALLNAGSTLPAVGASGAIAGVLGAYSFLYPRGRVIVLVPLFFIPYFFQLPAFFFLGVWFLMQLLSGTIAIGMRATGGVAWWAHVGGFVAGALLHRLFVSRQRPAPVEYGLQGGWVRRPRRGPFRSDEDW